MSYAEHNTRRKRGVRIDHPHRPVLLEIHFPFIQNVRTGNVEYGLLRVGAADQKDDQKKQQKLEGPDISLCGQGDSA